MVFGYTNILCELDSLLAIQLIQQGINNHHSHAPIAKKIRALLDLSWQL